jgi:hypothetical protein
MAPILVRIMGRRGHDRRIALLSNAHRSAATRGALMPVGILIGVLACCTSHPKFPLTTLASNLEPLRTQFNQDVGRVRLMLLIDPT